MKILQCGQTKSGNYWLYSIIQNALRAGGYPTHTFIKDHPIFPVAREWDYSFKERVNIDTIYIYDNYVEMIIGSTFRYPIEDFEEYLAKTTHVWTHSQIGKLSRELYEKFDKVVYIIRDPRDSLISYSNWLFTPYKMKFAPTEFDSPEEYIEENLDMRIRSWIKHIARHIKFHDLIHFVFYERLLFDFNNEFSKLLAYLEIDLSPENWGLIKEKVSFQNMHKENPNHVHKGKYGQWVSTLTNSQQKKAIQIGKPLLKYLNYPIYINEVLNIKDHLPMLPSTIDDSKLDKILKYSERFRLADVFSIIRRVIKKQVSANL